MSKVYLAKIRPAEDKPDYVGMENPFPCSPSGQINDYHKGSLIYYDHKTKKYYQILAANIIDIKEEYQRNDFTKSLVIDLDPEHGMVREIEL